MMQSTAWLVQPCCYQASGTVVAPCRCSSPASFAVCTLIAAVGQLRGLHFGSSCLQAQQPAALPCSLLQPSPDCCKGFSTAGLPGLAYAHASQQALQQPSFRCLDDACRRSSCPQGQHCVHNMQSIRACPNNPRLDAVIVPCCRDGWQRRPRTWRDWGNPWPRSASACSTLLGERGWLLQRPLSWRVELAGSGDLMLLLQMQHCGSQPLQQWLSNPRLSAAAPACWRKRARLCLLACSMGPARRSRQH